MSDSSEIWSSLIGVRPLGFQALYDGIAMEGFSLIFQLRVVPFKWGIISECL